MVEEQKTLVHRWFEEVWNKKNGDAVKEMFADDGIAYSLGNNGEVIRGPEEFKNFQQAFISAYPDLEVTVEDAVVEGGKIAARCTVRGTHEGDGLDIAPTKQPVEFTGMTFVRVKDGKIVEAWNEFDFMKMYSQLGTLSLNTK